MVSKKIYFAADFHLGAQYIANPREYEKRIVRWLDSIKHDASALYLLGDILDYWYEYRYVVPRGFTRFFGKLAELSDSGVEIHWFIGNHDIWIFDYLPHELGITIHDGTLITEIGGKRLFLSHGDNVGERPQSFRILRSIFRNRFCQRLYATIHPRWSVGFALGWSSHSRKAGESPKYQGEKNEPLVCFAKEYIETEAIDYFIFGHRHILLDLALPRQSRITILGDWMQNPSYATLDENGLMIYDYIEEE